MNKNAGAATAFRPTYPSSNAMLLRFVFLLAIAATFTIDASIGWTNDRPNLIWINAEDMSPHLGCYGHPDAVTPNIDALAKQGVVFDNAFATAPICSPARSCLATGLYATSLGTQHLRCEVSIPDRVVPLATRMRELAYFCTNTGKSDYNFDPTGIWDVWNNDLAPWKQREKDQPFFAFITVGETHEGRINTAEKYLQATKDLPKSLLHDPAKVTIPPFYPDTPEIRRIFAGMHDLATVFDRKIGRLVAQLEADGDLDNTIIFIFGDHGNGLPRYKRWLTDSGLRVPLVVYVPDQHRSLVPATLGSHTERLVSFVDFPATAMALAGADVPEIFQGIPFMGEAIADPREYVFGARSRADDMYDVARSVSDGRYIYIRHFMPHLPYMQKSVINGDRKDATKELRRLHHAGKLEGAAALVWAPRKPVEEFYDLKTDPNELVNLADSPAHAQRKGELAERLRDWILKHRDSGLLPEAEYHRQAQLTDTTPFDVVQEEAHFDLSATLDAAWNVGDNEVAIGEIAKGLEHQEVGVRYWSAVALLDRFRTEETASSSALSPLHQALEDESPSVRIAAAEAILEVSTEGDSLTTDALDCLGESLKSESPTVALQAARAIALQGVRAKALVPTMKQVVGSNLSAPGSRRTYKDFNYASFTGWALETALTECGEAEFVTQINNR